MLSAGILAGQSTAAVEPTDDRAATGGITATGTVVETADGDLVYVRPGQEPPRGRRTPTTTASDGELTIAATTVSAGPSFASNGVADIWIGAYTDSDGITKPAAGEPMTVEITRPDGESESFDIQTNQEGNHRLEYDLSDPGRTDGEYSVEIDHDSVSWPETIRFDVGTVVDITTRTRQPAPVGREVTISALTRNGDHPESGVDVDVSVTDPDGTELVETVETTDQYGFATASFTPAQTGSHSISVETVDGETDSASSNLSVVDVAAASLLQFRHAIAGQQNVYGGYLTDGDELIPNTTMTLQFVERFGGDDVVVEEHVTSDEAGFFMTEFELPADVERDLDIEAELDDGREVSLSVDRLRVNQLDDEADPDDVSLDASFSSWRYAPGTEADIEIEAEAGGDPITNTEVDIILQYEFNAPVFSTTVTTADDGTATATVPLSETAPDSVRIRGEASIAYGDERHTDFLSTNVEQYDISFDVDATAGGTSEFSVDVTDRQTGAAVDDIPVSYDGQYAYSAVGSFAQGGLVSGADGTDESTVSIPSDVQFLEYANYRHRYQERVYRWLEPEYPGELSIQSGSVAAGETITVDVTTPDGSSAQGIVFGRVGSPRKSVATAVSTAESGSITIPDHAGGDNLSLRLWAVDDTGSLYSDYLFADVAADPGETHESGVPQDVFDAVDQSGDGELTLEEIVEANIERVNDPNNEVNGVEVSLGELVQLNIWRVSG